MEEANETLWRSIDSSSSDLGEYFRSPAKSSDGSASFITPLATPQKTVPVEEGLLDALRNLQIASIKKSAVTRPEIAIEPLPLIVDATELDGTVDATITDEPDTSEVTKDDDKANCDEVDAESTTDVPTEEENKEEESGVDVIESTEDAEIKGEDKQEEAVDVRNIEDTKIKELFVAPAVLENMKKAVKPLFKPTTRKVTVGVSPMLHTRSRSRVPKTESLSQLNQTTNNKTKTSTMDRSSSLKRQSTKNVVATIVSTKDGIKLKEEKIANFGIPVSERKKKRTQAVPFSFADRSREAQKQPMRDVNAQNYKTPIITTATKKFNEKEFNRSLLTTTKQLANTFAADESLNKENVTLNKSRVPGPPKLATDRRVRERREFDEKVRQREREIEEMRAQVELRKQQREKMSELEMRKRMETRAKPVPLFKVPAPVRSRKPLTEPQSPAWALKAKRA